MRDLRRKHPEMVARTFGPHLNDLACLRHRRTEERTAPLCAQFRIPGATSISRYPALRPSPSTSLQGARCRRISHEAV